MQFLRYNSTRGRGIDWALFHSTNLTSLKAGSYRSKRNSTFNFDELELDIWGDDDQEQRLCSIAKAGIQLEKLKLVCLSGFDIARIMTTLHVCPALKHFEVECACWFSDYAMQVLCECLPNIISIKLRGSLPATTFSVLAKECPALSEITLNIGSSGEIQDDFVMNLERNYRIRYLDLSNSPHLNDKLLKDIVVSCSNLHTLKVERCVQVTKEGLEKVLKSCPQVKHLKSDRIR
ncbi:hypothetical protein Vadar_009695 [Vaccinium darrowii]|uniref:Uncharacterized protein n=1 Tax=Vaccinium darrowii TaxID=229202 RepID=A0ACB7WZI5_9ERIC|nr:hypothetical protein Vadar_009695 [Vaccinium darrowii]